MTQKAPPREPEARNSRRRRILLLTGKWARRVVVVLAFAYAFGLVALAVALALIGEDHWLTTVLLYVPRLLFVAPLPFVALALWLARARKYLWTQAVAALVGVFPLLGFTLPWPRSAREGAARIRVLSFNVNSGYIGWEKLGEQIKSYSPDLVLVQEAQWADPLVRSLSARYPHVQASTQFVFASKFPILESTSPPRLPFFGVERSPRFMRYLVDTPLGRLAVYNIHPISPRGALHIHRARDALHVLRTGKAFVGDVEAGVEGNATLRRLQVEAVANMARAEREPVLIAGDMNLPGLSPVFRRTFAGYDDAFREASWGLGYTYPAKRAWLRLDRVLGSDALRFVSFEVACPQTSDHRCVIADFEREARP